MCMDKPALFHFKPCRHQVICEPCGLAWLTTNATCMICRIESTGIERTYREPKQESMAKLKKAGTGLDFGLDALKKFEDDAIVVGPGEEPPAAPEDGTAQTGEGGTAGESRVPSLRRSGPGKSFDEIIADRNQRAVVAQRADASKKAVGPHFVLVDFKLDMHPRDAPSAAHYHGSKAEWYRANRRDVHQTEWMTEDVRLPSGREFKRKVTLCEVGDFCCCRPAGGI